MSASAGNAAGGLSDLFLDASPVGVDVCGPADVAQIPVVSRKRKTSVRPSTQFFLTLDISREDTQSRCLVVNYFSSELNTYVVGLEKSRSSTRVSTHLHCFLEFKDSQLLEALRPRVIKYIDETVKYPLL